jgi:hypothetical protein
MRPSWHVDLKWLAGLLACVAVAVSCVLFSLRQVTERDTALPISSAILAAGISDRVTDEDYAAVQAQAAANPDGMISLGPVSLVVKGSEITTLKKDEAARLIATDLAAVIYDGGSEKAETFIVPPPADSDKKALSLGPAGSLSADMHSSFQTYLILAVVITAFLLGVVMAMSRGVGRLGAPAFVVALGAAPLAGVWALAAVAIGDGDIGDNPGIRAAREAARNAAGDLRTTFLSLVVVAAAAAVGALGTGVAINVVRWARKPDPASPAPQGYGAQALPKSEPVS